MLETTAPIASTHLLLIDAQNDFCDHPASACPPGVAPALPVAGADADLQRVAHLLRTAGPRIAALTLTLDSHQRHDIAHPPFWRQADGREVAPFTLIRAADVRAGTYRPAQAEALPRGLAYLEALEAQGRYTHMVWPVHCEEGTWGHALHPAIAAACDGWAHATGRAPLFVFKGRNPWTEHYSAVQAEVPDPADPATQPNTELLAALAPAGEIIVAGQAASHCVRATVEHLMAQLPRPERFTLLVDGMSPVGGFEAEAEAFFAHAQARGARRMRCAEWLASRSW